MKRSTIQFSAFFILSLLLITLVLSGCALINRGGAEEESVAPSVVFGDQATLGGNGTLMCTQACSERGFCGTDANGSRFILLNSSGPATLVQDVIIPDNTPVTILGVDKPEAEVRSTGERFLIDYYLVNAAENGQGWVAGWCIGQ